MKEKTIEEINTEIESKRLKELCEITEPSHPGSKFRRLFEDMKKKLKYDVKIKKDFFPENKLKTEESK